MGLFRKQGRRLSLPLDRVIVTDVVHYGSQIPLVSATYTLDVPELAALRQRGCPKIAWPVLLMKAYAILSQKHPELRRIYMRYPWPHLYEHHESVAMMCLERREPSGNRLFFARFGPADRKSLLQLQARLDECQSTPTMQYRQFRHQITWSRMPAWLRRLGWWIMLNVSGPKRVHNLGTFGMTVNSIAGINGQNLIAPVTSAIGYAPLKHDGSCRILMTVDHRVIDGGFMGRILLELNQVLRGPVCEELRQLIQANQAQKPAASVVNT